MLDRITSPVSMLAAALTLLVSAVSNADELVVTSVKPKNSAASQLLETYGVKRSDVDRIKSSLPKLQHVVVTRVVPQQVARRGAVELDVRLIGASAALHNVDKLSLERGRFLIDQDVRKRNSVAVLGSRAAAMLFPNQDPIGKEVRVGKQYFVVIGVLKSAGAKRPPDLDVFIPITTMRVRFGDTSVRRNSGTFAAERYELSEARFVFAGQEAEQSKSVVEQTLRRSHVVKDYLIRVKK